MHFAHHTRQERRGEQQGDVSPGLRDILDKPNASQASHSCFAGAPHGLGIHCLDSQLISINFLTLIYLFFASQRGLALFVQLMPILILVLSALSQLMVTQPPYSLSYRP